LESSVRGLEAARGGDDKQRVLDQAFSGVKVFITRPGVEPVVTDLAGLAGILSRDGKLRSDLNKSGLVRMVTAKKSAAGGLTPADTAEVVKALRSSGLSAKLQGETIAIDWERPQAPAPIASVPVADASVPGPSAPTSPWQRYLFGPLAAPLREIGYLAHTLRAAYTNPTGNEIIGGIIAKAIPSVLTVLAWSALYAGNPAALAVSLGVVLGLNAFHGIWINTWSNFQSIIGKQRGLQYQTIFNLLYGQWWGAFFRSIAWTALPGTIPPWSGRYWQDVGVTTVLGTFFGTLGFQGLNILYDNGRINRWQRGAIQQVRDFALALGGIYFASGAMSMFWPMFLAQQSLDIIIYVISQKLARRPMVYVADDKVAAAPEFQSMYPVGPGSVNPESPLRQAWRMLTENPLVRPVVWTAQALWRALKKIGKS
jgi:hypothetical protein